MFSRLVNTIIFSIGIVLTGGVYWKYQVDLNRALETYQRESFEDSQLVVNKVQIALRDLYQNMRMLSRLPAVMQIDRYAKNFDQNGRKTAQEIYNNLYSNIAISELYIVPSDFDPDRLDPQTAALEVPIATFDEFIVGRNAGSEAKPEGGESAGRKVEEVEIYEYRLMKQQLSWLTHNFPRVDKISGIDVPAISGPQVITCDNSHYHPSSPIDQDRSGIVYSLPFYDINGSLKGIVSAVLLTSVLEHLLPTANFALRQANNLYTVIPPGEGQARIYPDEVQELKGVSSLLFSRVIPLAVQDSRGTWALWVGYPDLLYWARSDVASARRFALAGAILVWVVVSALLVLITSLKRQRSQAEQINVRLEEGIKKRTEEITKANEKLEVAVLVAEKFAQDAQESNRAKSIFLANMSHEIRTPINGVLSMMHVLLNMKLETAQRDLIHMAKDSASLLLQIINDILDFSKIEAGALTIELSRCNISEIVQEALVSTSLKAYEKNLEVICDIDSKMASAVMADSTRLRQVLINLLGNAIKFTERGEVVLRLVTIRTDDKVQRVRFSVSDTGIGMSSQALFGVFKAFSQADGSTSRKYGGTGLGLSISKQLVEKMGGIIWAESTEGQGSTFYFELEFAFDQTSADRFKAPPRFKGKRALVAVENTSLANSLQHSLALMQVQATRCVGYTHVLQMLTNGENSAENIDLIFLSSQGYDGAERQVIEQILADPRTSGLKIIPIIPIHCVADVTRFKELGLPATLLKPFIPEQVIEKVSALFGLNEHAVAKDAGVLNRRADELLPTKKPKRILVVDDIKMNRTVAKLMLEQWGHQVEVAESGKKSIEMLEREQYFNTQAQVSPFDLILMDIEMPELDGVQTTRLLRDREPKEIERQIPIVALTAHTLLGDKDRFLAQKMLGYLAKPINPVELYEFVEEIPSLGARQPVQAVLVAPAVVPTEKSGSIDFRDLYERFSGSSEVVCEVIEATLEDLPALFSELERTIASVEPIKIRKAAHALKGVFLNACANDAAQIAASIEAFASAGQTTEVNVQMDSLKREFGMVVDSLKVHAAKNQAGH